MTETFRRANLPFLTVCASALLLTRLAAPCLAELASTTNLPVEITWGHRAANVHPFYVRLARSELTLADTKLAHGEAADVLQDGVARTSAGAGDVDGLSCTLRFAPKSIEPITNAHPIWKHLWQHGDAGAAQRLQADPACRPDSRKLTVQLDEAGTRGFSLTLDQLLTQKTFWLPELDVFVSAGEPPVSFAAHQQVLEAKRGQRVLDQVAREPEATYAQYTARWEDMGSPDYHNPASVLPGHFVGLTWDSALYKFGVDGLAEVRNDCGKLERFLMSFDFGDPHQGLAQAWTGQRLTEGLPVITTTFEKDGVRCEVEQFACRNMLLNELTGDSLFVGQAIPREWLADGKQVSASGAPTYFGPVNMKFTSEAAKGIIHVVVEFRSARRPPTLLVRLRHPEEKPLRAVTVNGQKWTGFDPVREWVRIGAPQAARYDITAHY